VADKIWKKFVSSGIKSKKIFVLLFGKANYADKKFVQQVK
jgi:hypothetical protein